MDLFKAGVDELFPNHFSFAPGPPWNCLQTIDSFWRLGEADAMTNYVFCSAGVETYRGDLRGD